ncbi:MAG TPA: phosphoribosylaminoimidazolesuccinocarboxamide synthase [Fibrobacteria bacterium]|nr:phosphoribosylaminoimidazolesuccinocarboxamide synthase [Fibrobacteria bacterium]
MHDPVTSSPPPITEIPLFSRGKVRDVYDLGDKLLMVATDRLSAFDVVLPTPIRDKGKILTQLSVFWFNHLGVPSHFLSADVKDLPASLDRHRDYLRGRFMLVKKAKRFDVECVARGYLAGSGWKDYQATGAVCGHALPPGLKLSGKLDPPLFTPAAKNDVGHDENIDFKAMEKMIGPADADRLRGLTLDIYSRARAYALGKGVILADTKFEFGVVDGKTILIDEVLTPDSSRFWPAAGYAEGREQDSFDKQYVRDYLNTLDWGKTYPGPELPAEVVENTRRKYLEAYALLTGKEFREQP